MTPAAELEGLVDALVERVRLSVRSGDTHALYDARAALLAYYERLKQELDEARTEAEQRQVQLAGVSVAALGGTSPETRAVEGQYGWSVAYQDTLKLRLKYDAAEARAERLTQRIADVVEQAAQHIETWSTDKTVPLMAAEIRALASPSAGRE